MLDKAAYGLLSRAVDHWYAEDAGYTAMAAHVPCHLTSAQLYATMGTQNDGKDTG